MHSRGLETVQQTGAWTHVLRLKPNLNADWDLNLANAYGLLTEIMRSHSWFQDLMKLRFLMSYHRKNSVRDKVIGKKWIYLERNTLHRQSVGHFKRWE